MVTTMTVLSNPSSAFIRKTGLESVVASKNLNLTLNLS